ncbi:MAG: TetR family transcriptional regulator [Lachnospiraceae bacterium]|nr:TetR family transcriptional regulator [Lachnospiraceae bacterium]
MPPKPKFTREEIVEAALDLVSEKGLPALTARDLGAKLGCSARPIFTVFNSMEEVKLEVRDAAMKRFEGYTKKAEAYTPTFKRIGMMMVLFAIEEPRLYQILFMDANDSLKSFDDVIGTLGETGSTSLKVLKEDYHLTDEQAETLFRHVWVFTFGIGVMCAMGVCHFQEEEISEMLSQNFQAILMSIKAGEQN